MTFWAGDSPETSSTNWASRYRNSSLFLLRTSPGWMRKSLSAVPRVATFLRLDYCSHEAARYAVMHWHYSRSVPAGKLVKIGVWETGEFIGCLIFSYGANRNLAKSVGLTQMEVCELTR